MAPAAATKKRTKKKPHVDDDDDDDDVDGWMTTDDGWTGVNVNTNALMLGASEEGFMSLEVLDASSAKAAVAAATRSDSGTTTAVGAKPKEKIKIFGGDFVAMDKPAKDAGTKAGAKGKGAAKAPSTLNALDEDALDGLSGKEARIMKRKLRWKAKIEAKKFAKKNG